VTRRLFIVVMSAVAALAITGVVASAAPDRTSNNVVAKLHVQARIPIGRFAGGIVGAEGSVWAVAIYPKNEIVQINPGTNRVVARLALGGTPSPAEVAWITYGDGSLWVSRKDAGEVDRVSLSPLKVVDRVKLESPFDVAVAGNSVFVPQFDPYQWSTIDTSTNKTTDSQPATGPTSAVFDNGAIWMLAHRAQTLLRIDPTTDTVTEKIPVKTGGSVPERVAAGFGSIWATDPRSGSIARIDENTGKQLVEIVLPTVPLLNPYPIATGGGSVWVSADHGVGRIDPTTNQVTGTLRLAFDNKACGPGADNICTNGITYANDSVWVTDFYKRQVLRISPR